MFLSEKNMMVFVAAVVTTSRHCCVSHRDFVANLKAECINLFAIQTFTCYSLVTKSNINNSLCFKMLWTEERQNKLFFSSGLFCSRYKTESADYNINPLKVFY